jgi:nitroreductase
VDAYLAIVGKREVRKYEDRPIAESVLTQILEAGRASGSSKNTQPWRFVLVTDRTRLRELSECVTRPTNLQGCAAAIVVVLTNPRSGFDGGRTAQNMMLAAWTLGVGTCPNSPANEAAVKRLIGAPEPAVVPTILSLGYPAAGERRPRKTADPARVLARINRLPLTDLVHRNALGL